MLNVSETRRSRKGRSLNRIEKEKSKKNSGIHQKRSKDQSSKEQAITKANNGDLPQVVVCLSIESSEDVPALGRRESVKCAILRPISDRIVWGIVRVRIAGIGSNGKKKRAGGKKRECVC